MGLRRSFHLIIGLLLGSGLALQSADLSTADFHKRKRKVKKPPRVKVSKVVKPLPVAPKKKSPLKRQFRVLIDPGHGGKDKGAKGFGLFEKNLALKVATHVVRNLATKKKKSPFHVQASLTRFDDRFIKLSERAEMANNWNADLFVSIHANWSPAKRARGYEVYFLSAEASDEATNKVVAAENVDAVQAPVQSDILKILKDVRLTHHVHESAHFAESLYHSLSKWIKPNVRAVRQGPFAVLSGTQMPAVLIEIGYVSNVYDANQLANQGYLKRIADAISGGIRDYLRTTKSLG